MAAQHILAIDQGTTSTRAIVFDAAGRPVASAQKELPQIFPKPGWVEHDPEEIWSATVEVCREALAKAKLDAAERSPASASPTSARPRWSGTAPPASRSTTPSSGRTAAPPSAATSCRRAGHEDAGHGQDRPAARSVFLRHQDRLDPRPRGRRARRRAEQGELAAGTIDSFLLWRLTGGKVHATDATNAIAHAAVRHPTGRWDDEPAEAVRRARGAAAARSWTAPATSASPTADIFGAPVPILGMAGDQQAALSARPASSPAW